MPNGIGKGSSVFVSLDFINFVVDGFNFNQRGRFPLPYGYPAGCADDDDDEKKT